MTAEQPSPEVEVGFPTPQHGRDDGDSHSGRGVSPDLLDDVFGLPPRSSSDEPSSAAAAALDAHPSDIPRLRSQHYTAGYRDGYIDSKGTSIQVGFDEGYSLGATIGLRVGQLLGVLEGLAEAAPGGDSEAAALAMLASARAELATDGVFTPEHWASDGTWEFEVGPRRGKPAEEDGEVIFADVAEAHPVLVKWRRAVEEEMARWGVSWDAFEHGRGEDMGVEGASGASEEPTGGDVADGGDDDAVAAGTKRKGKGGGRAKKTVLDW